MRRRIESPLSMPISASSSKMALACSTSCTAGASEQTQLTQTLFLVVSHLRGGQLPTLCSSFCYFQGNYHRKRQWETRKRSAYLQKSHHEWQTCLWRPDGMKTSWDHVSAPKTKATSQPLCARAPVGNQETLSLLTEIASWEADMSWKQLKLGPLNRTKDKSN